MTLPRNPVVEVDVLVTVRSDADGGVLVVLAEEEAVDVGFYLRELHLRQLT